MEGSETRPNIILVITDDQPISSVSYLPELNARLIERGVTFRNSYTTTPVCAVSRASTLRGQYAHNTNIIKNDNAAERFRSLGLAGDTLGTRMREAGYLSGFFGKFLNSYHAVSGWEPPGWDRWMGLVSPLDESGPHDFNVDGNVRTISGLLSSVLTSKAIEFMQHSVEAGAPFIALLCPTAPHGPYGPAPRHEHAFDGVPLPWVPSFNEADVSDKPEWVRSIPPLTLSEQAEIRRVWEMKLEELLSVEDMLAGLDAFLEDSGEMGNTHVIYTTDNGFFLGEHRLSAKGHLYEEAVRVPLAWRGPGVQERAQRDELVSNVDLMPTLLDLAGAQPPEYCDGRSLAPLLRGETPPWRDALLLEWLSPPDRFSATTWSAVRTLGDTLGNALYAEHSTGERELYDLTSDAYELENLANSGEYASRMEAMRTRLAALEGCAGQTCRTAEGG